MVTPPSREDALCRQKNSPTGMWFCLPLCVVLCSVLTFFTIDQPVGAYFVSQPVKGELRHFLSAAEHFGTPWGQMLALLGVAAATGWRERRGVRIILGATAAGIAANIIKLMVARTRPRAFNFDTLTLGDGFVTLFPFGAGGSDVQSFPSGHTASAFGFACLLTWAYPRGRGVFLAFAGLAGLQRIASSAHFPSDVLVASALGWLVGSTFIHWKSLAALFDGWERGRIQGSQPADQSDAPFSVPQSVN